jgi:broad specificity phosphatase PhoE
MQKKIYSNNYYLIRHGHSKANEEGIIISNPEIGTLKYGLTENGKKQIKASAVKFPEIKITIIYSSDFLRTRESAEILKEILQTEDVLYTPLLRERFFGFYDSLGDDQYNEIWRTHGDCLQIMQTVFEQISPALHRSLKHINVAEIRKMRSDASSSEQ